MILIREYVDFLTKNKITQSQFLLLFLLYKRESDLIKKFKTTFPIKDGTMIPLKEIEDLVAREFLIKVNNKFRLGNKFLEIFVTPEVAVDEVFELYPAFMTSEKGVNIPLISMDKLVFQRIYIVKIQGSVKEHREVLKDIKYGVENDLLRIGINKFLTSELWKSIRKRRLTQTTSQPMPIDKNF